MAGLRVLAILASISLCSAIDTPDFGAGLQQILTTLGLRDNNATESGCAAACAYIHEHLPIPDALPSTKHYWKEQSFFWSAQQASQKPACFALPKSAADVSKLVLLAQEHQCKFAVKSGGHAAFVGASNIQDGITIDLQLLNGIEVSEDQTITRIGPGNRWLDVYEYLTPKELMVVGGRDAEIGVGGLTLGGGISWFSGRRGWALDGVNNYEVVVASGEVLDVNLESYPDLYWALRGGGNNFGIVTRLDLETFPQGGMWGGSKFGGPDSIQPTLDAFYHFSHNAGQDPDAGTYSALCWYPEYGMHITSTALVYAQPEEHPAIFENYTKMPSMQDTLKLRDMVDMAHETSSSSPNGLRESYRTATYQVSEEMLRTVADNFIAEVEAVRNVEGILPCAVFQPMTPGSVTNFQRNGGNCMGIEASEKPLMNVNYCTMWAKQEDDEEVLKFMRGTHAKDEEKAKELGLQHRYLYQNYAAEDQDVFAGYGEENRERLRSISKKYDPDQVFQKLQPGYFKL